MIRRPPRSTLDRSSAASDVYKRQILLKLVTKGISREDAYRIVQDSAMRVWSDEKLNLKDELTNSEELRKYISVEELNEIFENQNICLLYTSPSPRDRTRSRMPSSA